MIRTVLIDDEIDSIRVLQKLLETVCPEVEIVGLADGVENGFKVIRETDPDLVLLDIEMAQGNAFDLLNRLQPVEFKVIFVTAFDNYAIRAFKYSAMDYLLKPVDAEELRDAIARMPARQKGGDLVGQMRMLMENMGMINLAQQKIAIPTITGLMFVPMNDVIRLKGNGSYTTLCLASGEEIVATRSIKDYEDMLPETIFYRIHNSQIINLNRIQTYNKGRGGSVTMEDGSVVEVATRRREDFLRRLMK